MTTNLSGKVILITGAARGVGQALAIKLSCCGAAIAAADLNPIGLNETLDRISAHDGQVKDYYEDPTKRLPAVALVQNVLNDWGRIDVLIDAAEVTPDTPLIAIDEWDFHRIMDVNLTGPILLYQLVIPIMKDQGRGWIINLGANPNLPGAVYHASKAALAHLMETATRELADPTIQIVTLPQDDDLADKIVELLNA